jgi:hypothetical protein
MKRYKAGQDALKVAREVVADLRGAGERASFQVPSGGDNDYLRPTSNCILTGSRRGLS